MKLKCVINGIAEKNAITGATLDEIKVIADQRADSTLDFIILFGVKPDGTKVLKAERFNNKWVNKND